MIRLLTVGRTTVDVEPSFLIICALFVFSDVQTVGLQYALLWVPILFLSVTLHELAHAGASAAFGYGGSRIVLAGLGGYTVNQERKRPWHDMLISLAGPLSSFVIAFIATRFQPHDALLRALLPLLAQANIFWGIFNLVPVSPLDGGHVVRSFLRMFLRDRTAFVISIWIAFVTGALVIVISIYVKWYILAFLIAWYVWMNFQQWQYFRTHGYPGD